MVRFTVLASGSKGNATVISGGRTRILVDCGLSCREIFRRMKLADEEPETLDAILITHEHSDHVGGLAVTARKLGIPVYFTEGTHRAWMRWISPRRQMTYAQWLEQTRRQTAERQAEADAAGEEGEPDENDLAEAAEGQENEPQILRLAALAQDDSKGGARTGGLPDKISSGAKARVDKEASTARLKSCPDTNQAGRNHADTNQAGRNHADTNQADTNQAGASQAFPAACESTPELALAQEKDPTWLPAVEYFQAGEPFEIGEIAVSPFTIPHDAADPVGFVFRAEGVRMGFVTDLGYIPPNVKAQLQGLDLLLLESNHDLEMLRDGPYPWAVKQRVLSRVGHLSNEAAAGFLEEGYDGQAAYVILAHLSESNNLPELARVTAERALNGRASLLANRLLLAAQHEPLSSLYF
jgi:phosphoribosyl 1,2-cyclic phosphodiesterase